MSNIWYLPGPFHRYKEDVKELAAESGLYIIDANVTQDRSGAAAETPTVTFKEEKPVLVVGVGSESVSESLIAELEAIGLIVKAYESDKEYPNLEGLPEVAAGVLRAFVLVDHAYSELAADFEAAVASKKELESLLSSANETVAALQKRIDEAASGDAEKSVLQAKLTEKGIPFDGRAGIATLQKLLDEAS